MGQKLNINSLKVNSVQHWKSNYFVTNDYSKYLSNDVNIHKYLKSVLLKYGIFLNTFYILRDFDNKALLLFITVYPSRLRLNFKNRLFIHKKFRYNRFFRFKHKSRLNLRKYFFVPIRYTPNNINYFLCTTILFKFLFQSGVLTHLLQSKLVIVKEVNCDNVIGGKQIIFFFKRSSKYNIIKLVRRWKKFKLSGSSKKKVFYFNLLWNNYSRLSKRFYFNKLFFRSSKKLDPFSFNKKQIILDDLLKIQSTNWNDIKNFNVDYNKSINFLLSSSVKQKNIINSQVKNRIIGDYYYEKILFSNKLKNKRKLSLFRNNYKQQNFTNKLNNNIIIDNKFKFCNDKDFLTDFYIFKNIFTNNKKKNSIKKNRKLKRRIYSRRSFINILSYRIRQTLENLTNTKVNFYLLNLNSFNRGLSKNYKRFLIFKLRRYRYMTNFYSTLRVINLIMIMPVHNLLSYYIAWCIENEKYKQHFRFVMFIKNIVNIMWSYNNRNCKGLLIGIKGRINGIKRSRTFYIRKGIIPLQTIMSNVYYSQSYSNTIYGTFSISVWVTY